MKNLLIFILFITLNICITAQSSSNLNADKNNISNTELTLNSIVEGISERVITTTVIIGEIVILLLLLYYWKRTRNEAKLKSNKVYKKNIQAIRDERIKPNNNFKLSARRKALQNHKTLKSLNGKLITNRAKKMSIGKGELFLAAKITQLQSINK